MRHSTLLFAALALLLGGGGQVKAASLIVNGGFELPVLPNGGGEGFTGGSTGIPGWTVVGNDIGLLQTNLSELQNGIIRFNAQEGLNSVDLTGAFNTGPTDGITQTVATTSGSAYTLSFWVGRAQSDNGFSGYQDPATVDLSLNGGPRVSFTNSDQPTPGLVDWKQFSTSFVASGSSTTITFLNGTPINTDQAGLDNVTFTPSGTAVPEPGTLTLALVAGALGASGYAWRRWKRAA